MTAEQLRSVQAPLKDRYRADAGSAMGTLHARGRLDVERLQCVVETSGPSPVAAGIHPRAGGDGKGACAGDMLLQALVACAGVTLTAVATAMNLGVTGGAVSAEGDLDFRGTLGVSREAHVGFTDLRLNAEVDTTADDAALRKLAELTERTACGPEPEGADDCDHPSLGRLVASAGTGRYDRWHDVRNRGGGGSRPDMTTSWPPGN